MGKKHFYLKLDPSVSDEIERQYNRIVRNEEYLLEKDALGSAYFFGNESDLCKCNIMACIARDTKEKADALFTCFEYALERTPIAQHNIFV